MVIPFPSLMSNIPPITTNIENKRVYKLGSILNIRTLGCSSLGGRDYQSGTRAQKPCVVWLLGLSSILAL